MSNSQFTETRLSRTRLFLVQSQDPNDNWHTLLTCEDVDLAFQKAMKLISAGLAGVRILKQVTTLSDMKFSG